MVSSRRRRRHRLLLLRLALPPSLRLGVLLQRPPGSRRRRRRTDRHTRRDRHRLDCAPARAKAQATLARGQRNVPAGGPRRRGRRAAGGRAVSKGGAGRTCKIGYMVRLAHSRGAGRGTHLFLTVLLLLPPPVAALSTAATSTVGLSVGRVNTFSRFILTKGTKLFVCWPPCHALLT